MRFAASQVPFLDMAANQGALAEKIGGTTENRPSPNMDSPWDTFVGSKNLSLPDELQKSARSAHQHERARRHGQVYTIPGGAGHPHRGRPANEGGGAVGMGAGLGGGAWPLGQAHDGRREENRPRRPPAAGAPFCRKPNSAANVAKAIPAQRQISVRNGGKAPGVVPTACHERNRVGFVEAFGCSSQSLRDNTAVLQDLFNSIIREMKLRPVRRNAVASVFPSPEGSLASAFSAESHLACHHLSGAWLAMFESFSAVFPRAEWDFEICAAATL